MKMEVSEKEKNLIENLRCLPFGEIKIIVQNNEPIRIEEIKKSIKL
ncbi:DUF2292 domain-containing protein [Peptoniphilus sp. KCTC 25270]|nr:DUF2292 domain-containing protein [Peptoniphilus sp. KCTC 25270]MCD1146808.1 DUF2292 domain-containing protein [Peptoniphilus sp. KCTC 25270]